MSMLKSKHSGWTWDLKRTPFGGSGGGSSGGSPAPTQTNVQNTNIPEYAQPYVETMLGAGQQQIFNYDDSGNVSSMKPYTPYSANATDYIAGFSPLQQQAQSNIANMEVPGAYDTGLDFSSTAGLGALNTANPAMQYGGLGATYGGLGAQTGLGYGQNATNAQTVGSYMNPYLQNVLSPAMQLQQQQFGQIGAQNQGQATQQGAFGGGRQAVMQGLNQQNQMLAQNQLVGQGYSSAYDTAQKNMQAATSLGMQGTAQGMQGAQAGLQGVQGAQAAYQQLGAQGANMANIAGQQTQTGLNIAQAQQAAGAAQQAQQQNIINQQIQNYATAQQYPMTQLSNMSGLLRGLPMQATTTQSYQAAPSSVSTLGGLAATGLGAYGASGGFKTAKAGGLMKSYAAGGAVSFDVGGSVTSDLENMDNAHLMQEAKNSPSAQIRQEAIKILTERKMEEQAMSQGVGAAPATQAMQMAGGGIVAFAGDTDGSLVEAPKMTEEEMRGAFYGRLPKGSLDRLEPKTTTETTTKDMTQFANLPAPTRNPNEWRGLLDVIGDVYNPKRVDPKTGLSLTQAQYEQGPTLPPETKAPAPSVKAKTLAPKAIGLGATAPVQARDPAAPTKDESALGNVKDYYSQLQALIGTPEDRKTIGEGIKLSRNEAKAEREQNLWLALMQGGAKAMASKSPYANVGLGEGAGAAAEGAAYANKAYNLAMKEAQAGELDLAKLNSTERTNLLHYAVTGAVSDANTRTKMQELKEIAATRTQSAGQANLVRQDAAVTARAKLILGNTLMPTDQQVEDAITTATKQVTGKEGTSSNPFSPEAIAAEQARRKQK